MNNSGINRIKHENLIRSNYDFEQDIAESFTEELKELNSYLEFIFEHKSEELKIKREIRLENTSLDKNVPHDWYIKGEEHGTKKVDSAYLRTRYVNPVTSISMNMGYSISSDDKVSWIEWIIKYENIKKIDDNFSITITPFLITINTKSEERDESNSEILNLFTPIIYDKWASKLEEIFIEKKRNKVSRVISDSYKILGLERKAKIKSILKEE